MKILKMLYNKCTLTRFSIFGQTSKYQSTSVYFNLDLSKINAAYTLITFNEVSHEDSHLGGCH